MKNMNENDSPKKSTPISKEADKNIPNNNQVPQIGFKYEIDDMSYIAEMEHTKCGAWERYDFEIAARGYGWDDMIDWADYMTSADLDNISKVSKNLIPGANDEDILDEFLKYKNFKEMPSLKMESGVLSIGGISKSIGVPVMIVWTNQTQFLRILTVIDNDEILRRYTETVIRRTFNTPDAMKLAKPIKG